MKCFPDLVKLAKFIRDERFCPIVRDEHVQFGARVNAPGIRTRFYQRRFGTDFRQLYLSLHMPLLSEGGVDLQLGRQNVPIGYETLMAPYRPMYSDTYFWIHFQVGSTSATATWHATDDLDLLRGVILGYNTFFNLRGDSPCYLAKAIYSMGPEKQTKVSAAVYTGPEPFPVANGHLGSWQTGAGAQVIHNWCPRLTQEFLAYGAWDFNDPAVNRTSPTYGAFTILTYHLNQHLDLNGRGVRQG